jgi:hypothetical protein
VVCTSRDGSFFIVLRSIPGSLSPHLLEERPASLPGQLFVHGGHQPSQFSAVLFDSDGPRSIPLQGVDCVEHLMMSGQPIWMRVMALPDPHRIRQVIAPLEIPELLLPPTLEVPQHPWLDCLDEMFSMLD